MKGFKPVRVVVSESGKPEKIRVRKTEKSPITIKTTLTPNCILGEVRKGITGCFCELRSFSPSFIPVKTERVPITMEKHAVELGELKPDKRTKISTERGKSRAGLKRSETPKSA